MCPAIAITSDFIVGFPGETEADFEQTLELVHQVSFDNLFAFKYSDRPSAPARKFKPKVVEAVKNDRLQTLLDMQKEITAGKNRSLVGTCQSVLIEGQSKRSLNEDIKLPAHSGQWTGRTSTNKIVHFSLDGFSIDGPPEGTMIWIKIEKALAHSLWGRPVTIGAHSDNLKGEPSYAA
jgi:tRNA-2-methylthio-N6-dimethylallyladenosine synthase